MAIAGKLQFGKMYCKKYYEDTKWGSVIKKGYAVPVSEQFVGDEDKIILYYDVEFPDKLWEEYEDVVIDLWEEISDEN